jgi:hypothetical protein
MGYNAYGITATKLTQTPKHLVKRLFTINTATGLMRFGCLV